MRKTQPRKLEEYCRRREALAADRLRNRRIKELAETIERPTILPSTKHWIEAQIRLLKSGAAIEQGGRHA